MPKQANDFETRKAFHELLELIKGLDQKFFEGDNALRDEVSVLEGYRWVFSILQVATDCYLWADKNKPRFVEIVGPYKKWGGDNSDAFYFHAPIDPSRTYAVHVDPGDSVYLSITVYGGPDDGRYSERIVGSLNDREMVCNLDGSFDLILSPNEHAGNWIKLEPDAVVAITRDYVIDPKQSRKAQWSIECLDGSPVFKQTDADVARRLRAVATWVTQQAAMVPLPLGEPNTVADPIPVPKKTFGWGAGDASYAFGSFDLEPGQALVIEGRSPECAFWNMCLWNFFLHTYNYDYEPVTINKGQCHYNEDGSWRIVVAGENPGVPNWVSTQGHKRGRIWFRWFVPEATPERPTAKVVPITSLRRTQSQSHA